MLEHLVQIFDKSLFYIIFRFRAKLIYNSIAKRKRNMVIAYFNKLDGRAVNYYDG